MDLMVNFLKNIGPVVAAVNALLIGVIAIAVLIPGEQPEKALQSVVDFLSKLSIK